MAEVAFHNIRKSFGGPRQKSVDVLSDLDFSVNDGEIVALCGPSGCGKTTALRIAMGLEKATQGMCASMGGRCKAADLIAALFFSMPNCFLG